MNAKLACRVATLSAAAGLALSARAADWLYSGTALTEQGADAPWVLKVSLKKGTTELSVESVTTDGGNAELDFSGAIRDADGTDYTVVSLKGFTKKPITKVVLPAGLRSLWHSVFAECTALETVEPLLPDTVTSVGTCPFMGCASLTGDVKLTNASATVTFTHHNNNGYGAFQGCKKLASFEMTASIGHNQYGGGVLVQNMFYGCTSLGRAALPANVTKMTASGIFGGCTSLTNLCLRGTVPDMSESLFGAVPNGRLRVYVPKTDPAWTEDFCTAHVTPMDSALMADYSAVYPGERPPKGQFTWSKVKMWLCLYNPFPGSGLAVIVR